MTEAHTPAASVAARRPWSRDRHQSGRPARTHALPHPGPVAPPTTANPRSTTPTAAAATAVITIDPG